MICFSFWDSYFFAADKRIGLSPIALFATDFSCCTQIPADFSYLINAKSR